MTNNCKNDNTLASLRSQERKFLTPSQRKVLLKNLEADLQPEYRRRLEIILLADQGISQTQICQLLGCSQEMARSWISLAQAGLLHKWQERPIGRPKIVNEQYIERLKELVSHSPREYGYAFNCWTSHWLGKHLATEFGIEITERHINRLLKKMGLSTKQKPQQSDQNVPRMLTFCATCHSPSVSQVSRNTSTTTASRTV